MLFRTAPSIVVICALVACEPRESIETASFAELKKIYDSCVNTGKVQTDDYCKEAAFVYEKKEHQMLEANRLEKLKRETYPTQ